MEQKVNMPGYGSHHMVLNDGKDEIIDETSYFRPIRVQYVLHNCFTLPEKELHIFDF